MITHGQFCIKAICFALLLLASFPAQLLGQGHTWAGLSLQRMYESARWKFGPARLNAAWEVQNAGYDSDVYFGYFEGDQPDVTISSGIPVQLLLPVGKKALLDVSSAPRYVFYGKTSAYRGFNHTTTGRFHMALARLYLQAAAGSESILQPLSPELNINIRQKSFRLTGIALWQISSDVSLAGLYEGTRYDFGDAEFQGASLAETMNRKENFADVAVYIEPSSRLRLFLNGQYGSYEFENVLSRGRDTHGYSIFGGFEFIPRAVEQRPVSGAEGRITLGFKRFDVIDPLVRDDSAIVGEGDIEFPLFRRTSFHLNLLRDFQFSVFSDGTYFLTTSAGAGISRSISRRTSLSYDIGLIWGDYPSDDIGSPEGNDFRLVNHMLSMNFRLSRLLSITAFGSLGHRSIGEPRATHSRYFLGLNLFYGSPTGQLTAPIRGLSR